MQNIVITKSEDEQHLYVHDTKANIVVAYQLLKHIPNCHYLYIRSHTFQNYIKGMFGIELKVTDKVEDLGHNVLYVHKPKQKRSNERQSNKTATESL